MKFRSRRAGYLLLVTLGALVLMGASQPLNPLVTRRPEPVGGVSSECAEAIAETPLAPRLDVADVPLPEPPVREAEAPPSADLRARLRAAQDALERNDRAAFTEAVTRLRTIVDTYPRGGERTQAEDLLRVYGDISRLWEAQFESPFFAADSPLYATLNAYPGWAEHVRRRVLVDQRERRFYPVAESREFLTAVAAARLGGTRAGMPQRPAIIEEDLPAGTATARPRTGTTATSRPAATSPSRSTAAPSRVITSPSRQTTSPSRQTTSPSRASAYPAPRRSTTTTRRSESTASPRTTASKPPASTPEGAALTRTPDAGQTAPPAAPPVASTSATAAPPASSTEATGTAATDTYATTTTAEVTTTQAPPTSTTTDDATTATTGTAAAEPSRGRNVIIPVILILVGIGVLILLFRASS